MAGRKVKVVGNYSYRTYEEFAVMLDRDDVGEEAIRVALREQHNMTFSEDEEFSVDDYGIDEEG